MPFFRRISILESAAEFAELKAKEENKNNDDENDSTRPRRSTRQMATRPLRW